MLPREVHLFRASLTVGAEGQIHADIAGIAIGDGSSRNRIVIPGVHFFGAQLVLDQVIPVGVVSVTGIEHHVIAIFGFHNAGIAGLVIIQSPLLEVLNIAGVGGDVLVQAAGGAVAVVGFGVGKLGKKNATVLWPTRVAISGKESTPGGATELAELLGKEETLRRLDFSINLF